MCHDRRERKCLTQGHRFTEPKLDFGRDGRPVGRAAQSKALYSAAFIGGLGAALTAGEMPARCGVAKGGGKNEKGDSACRPQSSRWLTPQVGLEPTTLRLTVEKLVLPHTSSYITVYR